MKGSARIHLRRIAVRDLAVLAPWLQAEGFGVPAGISHDMWGARLRSDPRIVCRVAVARSRPAGFFRLDCAPDRSAEVSVLVAPPLRRRGLGRALLAAARAEASRRRLRRLVALVREDNAAALAFFVQEGFEESGRRVPGFAHLHAVVPRTRRQPPLERSAAT